MEGRPESHYAWLERNFKTITECLGLDEKYPGRSNGNFSSNGDKYYQYRLAWERHDIPWYHGAAMYHLMDLYFYNEVRQTDNGWVDPGKWVIDNYKGGHNLARGMQDL